jgi:hypothetical protein
MAARIIISLSEEDDDDYISCFTTSLPTVPVAPVTKIVDIANV